MSGKYEPPLTVASFATITHSRPSTTPMPVTTPALGACAVVDLPGCERVQLQERGARVDEPVDALAREQLAARVVPFDGALAAAGCDQRRTLAQLLDELLHPRLAAREVVRPLDATLEECHGGSLRCVQAEHEGDATRDAGRR